MSAPRKSERARLATEHAHNVNLALNNGVRATRAQLVSWCGHGQWLFRQFVSSGGKPKHFHAFARHCAGMLERMRGGAA